jgi:hypothetical protein
MRQSQRKFTNVFFHRHNLNWIPLLKISSRWANKSNHSLFQASIVLPPQFIPSAHRRSEETMSLFEPLLKSLSVRGLVPCRVTSPNTRLPMSSSIPHLTSFWSPLLSYYSRDSSRRCRLSWDSRRLNASSNRRMSWNIIIRCSLESVGGPRALPRE